MLTGGRKCVIFQLIDDHSRYAVASHVAWGETSEAAIAVFDKAIAAHGVPQRLLSDNGSALNPSRRGLLGQLVVHVMALGVEPITGKPYKPTTQGKNERFHQTLFRYLDKQPLADTLAELQAQVDAFDHIYNTERPHQGLPGRVTPQTAWEATAEGRGTRPTRDLIRRPATPAPTPAPAPVPTDLPDGTVVKTLTSAGIFMLDKVHYKVDGATRLRAGPRHHRRRQDHRRRPATARSSSSTPDPHPESPTSATADPAAHAPRPRTVTEVLTHQLSPMS